MTYLINKTDGTLLLTLAEGYTDSSKASITFIGRNVLNYGEIQNETFLHLLENFSNVNPPAYPLSGQLWFDSNASVLKLKFYDGTTWKQLSSMQYSSTATNQTSGDFWWNPDEQILYIKTENIYTPIAGSGYSGSSVAGDSGYSGAVGGVGPSGPSGYSGLPGSAAYRGDSGYSGAVGGAGTVGPSGPSGYSGTPGSAVYRGDSGYSGAIGDFGPSGPSGPSGYSGTPGSAVYRGDSGYSGAIGDFGPSGPSGYSGLPGSAAYRGDSGYSGAAGSGGVSVFVGDTPPDTIIEGSLWWNSLDGICYILYNGQWVELDPEIGGAGSVVSIGATPPTVSVDGSLWWDDTDGRCYIRYNGQWVELDPDLAVGGNGSGNAAVYVGDTAPAGVIQGTLWWNDVDGHCYIYYGGQWVELDPDNGCGGGGGTNVYIGENPPDTTVEGSLWWNDSVGNCYILYNGQWVILNSNGCSAPICAPTVQIFAISAGQTGTFHVGGSPFRPRAGLFYSLWNPSGGRLSSTVGSAGCIGFAGPGGTWDILRDAEHQQDPPYPQVPYTELINGSAFWSVGPHGIDQIAGATSGAFGTIYITDSLGNVLISASVTSWAEDGVYMTMDSPALNSAYIAVVYFP